MTEPRASPIQPHPRIMLRRLAVALHVARATSIEQIDRLDDSLAVLGGNGFAAAEGLQACLHRKRDALAALDPADPEAAPVVAAQVVELCALMERSVSELRRFVATRPDLLAALDQPP